MTGLFIMPEHWTGYEVDGRAISGHGYTTFTLTVILKNKGDSQAFRIPEVQTANNFKTETRLRDVFSIRLAVP